MSTSPAADAISRWDEQLAAEPDLDGSIEAWRSDFLKRGLEIDEELYRLHLGGLHDWIGHLLALEPRVAGEGALVRLDASLARTRLHFIEANADTPGGAGHNDAILDFFERMPAYRELGERFALRPLRLQAQQLAALLRSWEEWGGSGKPKLAILTRRGDPVAASGTSMDRDFYLSQGIEALATLTPTKCGQ